MTVVTELDLPLFDVFDPEWDATVDERTQQVLADGGWIVKSPLWFTVMYATPSGVSAR